MNSLKFENKFFLVAMEIVTMIFSKHVLLVSNSSPTLGTVITVTSLRRNVQVLHFQVWLSVKVIFFLKTFATVFLRQTYIKTITILQTYMSSIRDHMSTVVLFYSCLVIKSNDMDFPLHSRDIIKSSM